VSGLPKKKIAWLLTSFFVSLLIATL